MSYELLFIFFGLAWTGLLILGLIVFAGIRRLITPKPKPTEHDKAWQDIERRLSQ
jgi:cytochrome b561